MGHHAIDLDALSGGEQVELPEQIWDRLSQNPANVPVTEAQRRERDGRLDDLEEDVRAGGPRAVAAADLVETGSVSQAPV